MNNSRDAGPDHLSDVSPQRRVMISWIATNRRSKGLAEALGAETVFMPWAASRGPLVPTIVGWVRSAAKTVSVMRGLPRGSAVVLMVPPVWAPGVALLAGRRHRLGLDIHSGALNHHRWKWSARPLMWMARRFDVLIVTNLLLIDGYDTGSATVVVLTNPSLHNAPSEFDRTQVATSPGESPIVIFPASGEDDEPLDEVAEAARLLAGQVRVVATGSLPARLAGDALELSGFLPDAQYEQLMNSASAVLALTTREATNQRSAAEAIGRGLPLVCSDTEMLSKTYGRAAVMVKNNGASIAEGIQSALTNRDELSRNAVELRTELISEARDAIQTLATVLR